MKITRESIDYNTIRLIQELMNSFYEVCGDKPDEDHWRIATLGNICGILDMANVMKEVLEA